MRLRIDLACWALLLLALAGPARGEAAAPSVEQVHAVTESLYADPDLHGLKAERKLRWKADDAPAERPEGAPSWLVEFIHWISEAGRWLVWLAGAVALVMIGLRLRRWLGLRSDGAAARALSLPTHVRDLDIRPESLPDDVGAAARALWQRGESRAALSLLYRGALSRLVHGHGVPVRAASTEGECMQLAARHLGDPGRAFFARLVGLWQAAVYGAHLPDQASVLALCAEFETRLPRDAARP
jgi:hypothetical protein